MEAIDLICFRCKHQREFEVGCDAFPEGIPHEITSGENEHSIKLPEQKNNITFTPMGMEEETRDFLVRIVQTISIVLLWMIINVVVGIYFNYGFFEGRPRWENLLYYFLFILSLYLLIGHVRNKWKV